MRDVVLWGHRESGHACKVAVALALAGVGHATRVADIRAPRAGRPADFLRLSPFAEVPLLVIDGAPFVQSAAILWEIAERSGRLRGKGAAARARVREILFWEANRIGMCLPQLKEARRTGGEGIPPGAVEWLTMRYQVDRERFDRLIGGSAFLAGAAPTIADCAVFGYVQWLPEAGVAPSPAMAGWLARMRALPGVRSPADYFPEA